MCFDKSHSLECSILQIIMSIATKKVMVFCALSELEIMLGCFFFNLLLLRSCGLLFFVLCSFYYYCFFILRILQRPNENMTSFNVRKIVAWVSICLELISLTLSLNASFERNDMTLMYKYTYINCILLYHSLIRDICGCHLVLFSFYVLQHPVRCFSMEF